MNNIMSGYIESDAIHAKIPMGWSGTLDEIAATAVFLLPNHVIYITGQNICVDGGITHSI